MDMKFFTLMSVFVAISYANPTPIDNKQQKPSSGRPAWSKKPKDPALYTPPGYANCTAEVNQCIARMHTGDSARRCLKLMKSNKKYRTPGCSKFTNPDFQAYHNAMFDNSTSWHSDMYACLRGHPAPSGAKDVVCNNEPVPPKEYSADNPELAECWAATKLEKQQCMADVEETCPILATCMGLGPEASVEGKQADWHCYIKNKRRATTIAARIYSQKMKECRDNQSSNADDDDDEDGSN